jgi:hypothetical protein
MRGLSDIRAALPAIQVVARFTSAAAGPKGRLSARVEMEEESATFAMCPRGSSLALFTEGGPPARSLSPIVRMSAKQPRLALANLTKNLLESTSRPPKATAWRDSGAPACPGGGIFDLLASMAAVIAQTQAIDKQI